jgi:hypothetical protein
MTADERKRGLRAAVDAKIRKRTETQAKRLEALGAISAADLAAFTLRDAISLTWDVVDSLVDEIATLEAPLVHNDVRRADKNYACNNLICQLSGEHTQQCREAHVDKTI